MSSRSERSRSEVGRRRLRSSEGRPKTTEGRRRGFRSEAKKPEIDPVLYFCYTSIFITHQLTLVFGATPSPKSQCGPKAHWARLTEYGSEDERELVGRKYFAKVKFRNTPRGSTFSLRSKVSPPPFGRRMGTPLTQCGRPGYLDLSKFAAYSKGNTALITGDPNYGIIIGSSSDAPGGYSLNYPVKGVPPGWVNPPDSQCNDANSTVECPLLNSVSGCTYYGLPGGCVYNDGNKTSFYAGQWTQSTVPSNILQCCTNFASDPSQCAPDQCAASPGKCHAAMKSQCISTALNSQWQNPGSSGVTIPGACDQYVQATSGVIDSVNCPNGSTCGADFIYSAVQNYFNTGGTPFDDTYFASKIPEMCGQYPGLCDSPLAGACSTATLTGLNPSTWKGRQYDSQGTLPLQICGCFLPSSQYSSNFPTECQSSCSFPGTIPIGSGNPNQPAKQCTATECVIDNVTADYINSTGGTIGISQVCGQCSASSLATLGPPSGRCACYFSDISASGVNAPDISTNCQTCYAYDSTSGLSTQIPCPGASSSSSGGSKYFYIGLGIMLFALAIFFVWKMSSRIGK